jgi:hypothetical protein
MHSLFLRSLGIAGLALMFGFAETRLVADKNPADLLEVA